MCFSCGRILVVFFLYLFQCLNVLNIEAIEKVQKRATKLVISLKSPYKERLLQLNLHTLKYRRLRGDMIEVYQIIHDMYDRSVALELPRNVCIVLEV